MRKLLSIASGDTAIRSLAILAMPDLAKRPLGYPVLGGTALWEVHSPDGMIVAISSNLLRMQLVEQLGECATSYWMNALHPAAVIAVSVQLGHRVVVAAGAVINPDTVIGNHVIVNTDSSIDYDCRIADFVNVVRLSHIAGDVTFHEGAFLDVGASVLPEYQKWGMVDFGAGTPVVRNVPDGVTVKK